MAEDKDNAEVDVVSSRGDMDIRVSKLYMRRRYNTRIIIIYIHARGQL